MIVGQILAATAKKLKKSTIDNPQLEADVLLSFVLKKPREWLLAHPEHKLNSFQIINYKFKIRKRLKGVSLAYILGYKYFYGYKFIVNKNVLVPRPETEMMVDYVNELVTHNSQPITLVDVGTGSGCIVIAIAKNQKSPRLHSGQAKIKNQKFYGIDISNKTLRVAKKNAKYHGPTDKIKFFQGNLLSPIINEFQVMSSKLRVVICANLPYLTPKQLKNSPTIQAEPKNALKAGNDGLKYYRELFTQLKILKNKKITLLCEIDPGQSETITKLIKEKLPKYNFIIKKDLRGLNRLVILTKLTINN